MVQFDVARVNQRLATDYIRVYGNYQLGDIVVYFSQANEPYHSAVYIADDVLLTKNGPRSSRPWMLVRMEDMKWYYPRADAIQVGVFRRKDL
jgi:hypothetical protein